jgi:hypothetical protein
MRWEVEVPLRSSSKGSSRLGPVQMATLRVFEAAPLEVMDSREVARRVLGKDVLTNSEVAAIRRALRLLKTRGNVADLQRHWRDARRRWALLSARHERAAEGQIIDPH